MTKVRQEVAAPPRPVVDRFAEARIEIKRELERQKIRQHDLALAMAVSEKHISQVLTGVVKSPQMLADIAAELGLEFRLRPVASAEERDS